MAKYLYDEESLPTISYEIFRYVMTAALEIAAGILASIIIAVCLDMKIETVVFLAVFWILRSYAGGIHLDRFSHCFVFSAFVMTFTLLLVKYCHVSLWISHSMIGSGAVGFLFSEPESDKNRSVDELENKYFKRKLRQFLFVIMMIYGIYVCLEMYRYAFLIALTVDIVYLMMIMGKVKNKRVKGRNI